MSPRALFLDELIRFRRLLGERDFWERPEWQRKTAFDALAHLYLNTDGLTEGDQSSYVSVVSEYTMRDAFGASRRFRSTS